MLHDYRQRCDQLCHVERERARGMTLIESGRQRLQLRLTGRPGIEHMLQRRRHRNRHYRAR